MTLVIPPELGTVGDSEADTQRLADVWAHVHSVLTHRALTPAEQVTVLLQLATTIVVLCVNHPRRAMQFVAGLVGRCFALAEREHAAQTGEALRDAPPAGRA
jgi:hypothetical protein